MVAEQVEPGIAKGRYSMPISEIYSLLTVSRV